MTVLAIDAATKYCSVALQTGTEVLALKSRSVNSHSEDLLPLVKQLNQQVSLESLTELRLGSGPGSFTGLRIAYSFAIAFASSLKLPILTYSSFQAAAASSAAEQVLVKSDARRNEFFVAIYANQASSQVLEEQILTSLELSQLETTNPVIIDLSADNLELNLATGLLKLDANLAKSYQPDQFSQLQPHYLRQIAAKKIAERI